MPRDLCSCVGCLGFWSRLTWVSSKEPMTLKEHQESNKCCCLCFDSTILVQLKSCSKSLRSHRNPREHKLYPNALPMASRILPKLPPNWICIWSKKGTQLTAFNESLGLVPSNSISTKLRVVFVLTLLISLCQQQTFWSCDSPHPTPLLWSTCKPQPENHRSSLCWLLQSRGRILRKISSESSFNCWSLHWHVHMLS